MLRGHQVSVGSTRSLLAGQETEMLAVQLALSVLKITGGCEHTARGRT
jgi:hypothetical protein